MDRNYENLVKDKEDLPSVRLAHEYLQLLTGVPWYPVISCFACKHWDEFMERDIEPGRHYECQIIGRNVPPDHYCGWGELLYEPDPPDDAEEKEESA